MSAGFQRSGFVPVQAVELSRDAAATYRANVSDCVDTGSVDEIKYRLPADVIVAGPPCQGFSTLGRRDPTDTRNELSLSIVRWIDDVQPKMVVIENVPQFLRSFHFHSLRQRLADRGYAVTTWELEAADFGTPQLRRRAFTIASIIGLPERPPPSDSRMTVADAILNSDRPLLANDPLHVWPTPKGIAAERINLVPPGGDKRDILLKAPELCPPSWARVGCQATDVWGRMDPHQPSNTVRCTFQNPSKGRYLHPFENRVISLREGARLQGVPDHWNFIGSPYPVARQIGNGVPVPLAAAVGASLMSVFSDYAGAGNDNVKESAVSASSSPSSFSIASIAAM
ncbi:DNA cytosine methyltransferase [Aliihoeflea sp. PC F10.4]